MKKISVLFVKFAREEKKESTSLKLVGVWNERNKNRNNIQLENWYICSRNTLCYHQSVYNNVLKFIQFLELQISLDYLFLLNYNSPFFFFNFDRDRISCKHRRDFFSLYDYSSIDKKKRKSHFTSMYVFFTPSYDYLIVIIDFIDRIYIYII